MKDCFLKRRSVQAGIILAVLLVIGCQWLTKDWAGLYGGMVGGAFAFVGVLYGMEEHSTRERLNRQTEMRRLVYFDMAASVVEKCNLLAQFANPTLTDADIKKFSAAYVAHSAKFHLVAKLEAIKGLNEMDRRFMTAFMGMTMKRNELLTLKARLDAINRQFEDFMERIKATWSPESHGKNPAMAELSPFMNGLMERQNEVSGQMRNLSMLMQLEARAFLKTINPALSQAVLTARGELGFEMDAEAYSAEAEWNFDETEKLFSTFAGQVMGKQP